MSCLSGWLLSEWGGVSDAPRSSRNRDHGRSRRPTEAPSEPCDLHSQGAWPSVAVEADDAEDTAELGEQPPTLRGDYGPYVAKYGPLNWYTPPRTGREETVTDSMTGGPVLDAAMGRPAVVETLARIRPRPLVTFRHGPHTSLMRALERFDEESHTSPSSLLTKRP
jgi:hypothetical protein